MQSLDNTNISKHLGKTSAYKNTYDPTLLVREPRSSNRGYLGIEDGNLPFVGFDTWNAYECSFLLNNGLPVSGAIKLSYPANSKYIVESKSIKLYFNSFNMEKCGSNWHEGVDAFTKTVSADLSRLLETGVSVGFISNGIADIQHDMVYFKYQKDIFDTLEDKIFSEDLAAASFTKYTESPDLLTYHESDKEEWDHYHSALLKSNCRVTSQPDWGDIFIAIKSKRFIANIDLLKYIISFRDECHFHEEICECVYKRLLDICNPSELLVACVYARRGGIDINPVRATSSQLIQKYNVSKSLQNVYSAHTKTLKQ